MENEKLKDQILNLTKQYYKETFGEKKKFQEGDRIQYSGRVFDEEEMVNLVQASLEFWLTSGHFTDEFEDKLARYLNVSYCSLVNSGSSANLTAFMTLTSERLGDRRIKRGDEVITVAAGFPTTIAPIVQYGAIPVFLDITIPQYNIDISKLEEAVTDKTKAVFIAHTLGNPFNLEFLRDFCDRHGLWLVEDNCDALGSRYLYKGSWVFTGTVGDISTYSFYPPHHMTMGEGGAVCTSNSLLHRLINSFRDWGRDCWCRSGVDATCKRRYDQKFGELPEGYDHKYVYSNFGYNLKATDLQASIGCAQIDKLPEFAQQRRHNWEFLRDMLDSVSDKVILPEPEKNSQPSWFGFLMTVKDEAGFSRNDLVHYLESENIQTRYLFAGNIIKQPCFDTMRINKEGYRIVGNLDATNWVMNGSFWIGVYPGMNEEKLHFMADKIKTFVRV